MDYNMFEKLRSDADSYKCNPIWAESDGISIIGYMCLTDFECELGGASDGNHVYPSLSSLLADRRCAIECGVAEVEVKLKNILLSPINRKEYFNEEDGQLKKQIIVDREDYLMELERQQGILDVKTD